MSAEYSVSRTRPPAVPVSVLVVLAGYSLVLVGIELATSQAFVRHLVTDIEGPIPFYALNTSISVFLLWATALLFVQAACIKVHSHWNRPAVWWLLSQALMFAWLGCDDRFKFHELLGSRLNIGDHYVLLALAAVEGLLLAVACLRGWIYGPVVQTLLLASMLFGFMLGVDALAPHDLRLRLSVEDAAKTCACFFFLRFAWQMLFARNEQRLMDVAGEVRNGAPAAYRPELQIPPLTGRRVLLMGDDQRMVLPVARSLGTKGCEIHLGWTSPGSPIRASRHVHTVHELPLPAADGANWVAPLTSLLEQLKFDLVIPVTEPAVHALHASRSQLEHLARLSLLDGTVFRTASDKVAMEQLAREAGVCVRNSVVIHSVEQAEQYFSTGPGQVVIKPGCSVQGCSYGSKQFVQIVEDPGAALQIIGQLLNSGQNSVLLQKYFSGQGVGVEFLAKDGELLTVFQHRRLHETSGHGSTSRIGEAVSPELREATSRLIASLGYSGVGMCEFLRNEQTGEWIFVELNPRFWGSLPLACGSGADFPWYLYCQLHEEPCQHPQKFRIGQRYTSLTADVRWMRRAWRRHAEQNDVRNEHSRGWRLNPVSRWQILRDALRLILLRDRIDSLTLDDPAPFLHEVAGLLCWPARRFGLSQLNRQPAARAGHRVIPAPAELQNEPRELLQRVES